MQRTDLTDKVVIVTGAGQGLGAAICQTLAEDGAHIAACDIQEDKLGEVVKSLRNEKGTAGAFRLDVTDEKSVKAAVQAIIDTFGRVDMLVNNAGTDITQPLENLSIEDWDRVIGVKLRGPFLMSKALYPVFQAQNSGHIVNITSTAAKRTWTEASAYHASKWGLLGFSHSIHAEARKHGVKVSAVVAGGMRTPFILERFPETDTSTLQDPAAVAEAVRYVLTGPQESVVPEMMVLPMKETSWP